MTKSEIRSLNAVNVTLSLITLFAVSPFVVMFVWNTLATHMFGAFTIGYGGAWAIMVLRMLLPRTTASLDAEESLKVTLQAIFNSGMLVVITIIVGYAIGAL